MTPVETFAGRIVALFGLGGSGLATAEALKAGGAEVIVWDDGAGAVEKARAAGFRAEDLRTIDWSKVAALILSPGVPLTHPKPHWSVDLARAAGVEVIGDVELFCRERAARAPHSPFIAITGTNGKSTTTALIAHILKSAGRDVQLGGNIGTPILKLEAPRPSPAKVEAGSAQEGTGQENGRFHVIELSSYQIDLAPSLSPTIGVHLNLSPDHIDRHGTMENYAGIKERMVQAAQLAVIGVDDAMSEAIFLRAGQAGRRAVPVSLKAARPGGLHVQGRLIRNAQGEVLADLTGIGALRGDHNAQNAAMAVAVCLNCGLSAAEVQAGLASFPGLAHRMEELGRIGKALVVNDSKATNADSTEKALTSFDEGIFWIAGGKPKEGGIGALEAYFPRIAHAYLIGEAAPEFARTLQGKVPYTLSGTLETALGQAARDAADAKTSTPVILLSPSCASFDQFPNFEVRGDTFRALAARLEGFIAK